MGYFWNSSPKPPPQRVSPELQKLQQPIITQNDIDNAYSDLNNETNSYTKSEKIKKYNNLKNTYEKQENELDEIMYPPTTTREKLFKYTPYGGKKRSTKRKSTKRRSVKNKSRKSKKRSGRSKK